MIVMVCPRDSYQERYAEVPAALARCRARYEDSGHGMLFHAFDGKLMLVLHRPFRGARGKLYEMKDTGDHLEIVRERTDLDAQ